MIPLRTSRTFTVRGRPPRLAGRINGATSAHSASVRSLSYRRPRRSAAARCSGFHMRHLRIRCRPTNHKRFPRFKFFPEGLSDVEAVFLNRKRRAVRPGRPRKVNLQAADYADVQRMARMISSGEAKTKHAAAQMLALSLSERLRNARVKSLLRAFGTV